jgi:hypothetical protein
MARQSVTPREIVALHPTPRGPLGLRSLRTASSKSTWRVENDSFNGKPKASGSFVLRVRLFERRAQAVVFGSPLNELH